MITGLDPSDYPFDVPDGPYLWCVGTVAPLPDPFTALLTGRQPVLAIGSNAAPSQLNRKYAGPDFADAAIPDGSIPVTVASLRDVDVVHAAHVALYGSIPATVVRSLGCVAHVHLTWLTTAQLERMHETEGLGRRHHVCELPGVAGPGIPLGRAWCYVSDAGVLLRRGDPIGLAAIRVDGSTLPRVTQTELWDIVAGDSGLAVDGTNLLHDVVRDDGTRRAVAAWLASISTTDGLDDQRLASHSSMSRIISTASISKPLYGPD